MWYAPLYQDAANQSAIVQVMPVVARMQLPPETPAVVPTRHTAFHVPPGYVEWFTKPSRERQIKVPRPPAAAATVIPALYASVALPSAYRYSASKAVEYVAHKIGWKFVKQRGSVPMALAQIGMPWAPKTATALSLLKRMCDDVPAIDITVNMQTHTITYDAKL
ncbi:hypothetical protein A6M27_14415 [Acidithiobacillus thiooxidans]|uniref:Uncharacterized protein n=1 Tax=Acidithiobacillus thiooxidans TaxID=930 RepID=A0A1C2ING8_ACITH|nr:hypothetical protein [Acidithiobacillus thiooxidans]OCX68222.1 hypothetical protein A6P07_18535 [Acidithiobacillus thiooxidans]OCX77562.1 hypothetical protein A6O24_06435 [Acidithiobacillus thiooxidans]OCX79515.1 hypothetical protein A6O26_16330 [Acidithiobacillus thiooxidans]OCX85887.1 hypothetical protein A6M27_14415 [Acidithiobacillus thiooxidans]OFC51183.1 hypothetical protein BAE47_00075 [Acidithiobacillus thiooxidans]